LSDTGHSSGAEHATAVRREAADRGKSRDLRPFLRLLPYLLKYKPILIGALVFLFAAAGALIYFPIVIGNLVDEGFSIENPAQINQYVFAFVAVALLMGVAGAIRYFFVTWLGERVVADLRTDVYRHITSLSPAFFEITKTGEVLSRLTTDTTLIQTVVGSTVSIALRSAVQGVGAFIMLLVTSAYLTGITLLAVPIMLIVAIALGRRLRRLSRFSQDRIADTSAFAGESLNAIQTVQAFTHEPVDREQYDVAVEEAFHVAIRRVVARAILTSIVTSLAFACVGLVFWAGAQMVIETKIAAFELEQPATIATEQPTIGDTEPITEADQEQVAAEDKQEFSAGDLTQFIVYALFLAMSIASLSEVWTEIQRAAGATERLMELLDIESKIKAPENPVPLPKPAAGKVEFKTVTFCYPTRPEVSALDGLSFAVQPGERVALVGPSGAGKTTVFQLILRFYDPQTGSVSLDGINIADASPEDVRKRISVVQQDAVIFSGSAMENVRYGRPDATDSEVKEAADMALAAEFIDKMPHGYDTELGERGLMLSGGQRQRIAIARAILRNAPLLLLDEATSALDAESERVVQEALERTMKGRTSLVIAHRLATVVKADRIVVLEQGRLVDTGTHAELSAKGGLYAHLANLQFGDHDQVVP
jgi:ATP-binding cassette subfamily B protein